MIQQLELAEENQEQAAPPGVRIYLVVCVGAALALALPLLGRGLGLGAIFPSLVALLLTLARWRPGAILFLLALGWTLLADSMGLDPFTLAAQVLGTIVRLFVVSPRRSWSLGYMAPRLQHSVPALDILLGTAVLVWLASYQRLLSVTRSIFPLDRRRRGPSFGTSRPGTPSLHHPAARKRSPELVQWEEVGRLLMVTLLCGVLAVLLWRWLGRRDSRLDLAFLVPLGLQVHLNPGLWRLIVLVWIWGGVLLLVRGLLGYLGQLRLTPAEAALYLQDQVWRQTRREQARLNRWLAWAEKRQSRRR